MRDIIADGTLDRYLSKFDAMIDEEWLDHADRLARAVYDFRDVTGLPWCLFDASDAPDTDWPLFPYAEAVEDPARMLLNELREPFLHHQMRDCRPLNCRCNYGTITLATLFGVKYRRGANAVPWALHLENADAVRALVDRGMPDRRSGFGGMLFDTAAFYRETLSRYPVLARRVDFYHPDLQGPMDTAHIIWGSGILTALYDTPNLVHDLLRLVTDTYGMMMREWNAAFGVGRTHWTFHMKGGTLLRDDTAVMLSPEQYDEFCRPYDQEILDEFTGGIHYCGRGDHFVAAMAQSRNLTMLHLGQPELNDAALLFECLRSNRLVTTGYAEQYLPGDVTTGVMTCRGYRPAGETVVL